MGSEMCIRDSDYWVLMTTRKLSQGLSDKFLEKKGIIRVSDLDSGVKILDKNYEKNFLNKKVLLLKKAFEN